MKNTLLVMIFFWGIFNAVEAFPVESSADVGELVSQGFTFALAATANETDLVFVNEDANNLEFSVAGTVCRTRIFAKDDPVYEGETLGVISLECDSHGAKILSSASCSPRFAETQSHFEINDGKDFYILDLLCRSRSNERI